MLAAELRANGDWVQFQRALMSSAYDAIIIGGGAAGLYCAMHAGRRGRRVLVLEHNAEVGAKILISGGGRCNFTNLHAATRPLHLRQSALRALGAGAAHAARLHRAGREARHRVLREDARPTLLRRRRARRRRSCACCWTNARRAAWRSAPSAASPAFGAASASSSRPAKARSRARRSSIASGGLSIPEARRDAVRLSTSPSNSACPIDRAARRPRAAHVQRERPRLDAPLSGVSADVARVASARRRSARRRSSRIAASPARRSCRFRPIGDPATTIEVDWLPDAAEDVLAARKRERPKAQLKSVLAELLPERALRTRGVRSDRRGSPARTPALQARARRPEGRGAGRGGAQR